MKSLKLLSRPLLCAVGEMAMLVLSLIPQQLGLDEQVCRLFLGNCGLYCTISDLNIECNIFSLQA